MTRDHSWFIITILLLWTPTSHAGGPWGPVGALGALLGRSWGGLMPSWGILGRLGASGRRLRLDFRNEKTQINALHIGCHFEIDFLPS